MTPTTGAAASSTSAASDDVFSSVGQKARDTVRAAALQSLEKDSDSSVARYSCTLVAELAKRSVAEDSQSSTWPQLLPWMFNSVQSSESTLRYRALSLFAESARSIAPLATAYLGTVYTVIESSLKENDSKLKLAAFNAVVAFVSALSESKERLKFQQLVPLMVDSLGTALTSGDEATAQEALSSFVDLADSDPKFVRNHLSHVASSMLQVVESSSLEEDTRSMAAEFLITLVEARDKAPGMMRKLPDFGNRFFKALLDFLLDIEEDESWYNANSEESTEAGESDLYDSGQMNLDRLAIALGGRSTMQIASNLLPQYLQSSEWQARHAGLIAMSQIAEGCSKQMCKSLNETLSPCLSLVNDSHPRVRWAAVQCIGRMSTDLSETIQMRAHSQVLQALQTSLDDSCARVRANAANSIVNFAEAAEQEHLEGFLDSLISKLVGLLKGDSPRLVLEGTLSAISSLAQSAKEQFIKYYDTLIPLLKQLVEQAQGKELQSMRAKAIEAISLIGMGVGKERFQSDARGVMDMLLQLQQSASDQDDIIGQYTMQAFTRICTALGKDFVPYLQLVLPKVLEEASKTDVSVAQNEAEASANANDEDVIQAVTNEGKVVQLRTSALEEKATAASIIACYLETLKEELFPYLEKISNIMIGDNGLLTYTWHEGVRESAADAVPDLARSALAAAQAGKCSPDWAQGYCIQYVLPRLLSASENEEEPSVLESMLEAMSQMVRVCASYLDAQTLDTLAERALRTVDEARAKRNEKTERTKSEDFTDEDAELLEEEREEEDQVLDGAIELLTAFAKAYGADSLPLYERKFQRLYQLAHDGNHQDDIRVALCVFDDVLFYCGSSQKAQQLLEHIFPYMLGAAKASDTSLRQAACYGLGAAAEGVGAEVYKPYAGKASQALLEVVTSEGSRDPSNAVATDNAVSSLLKLLNPTLGPCIPQKQVAQAVAHSLPLEADQEEAEVVHPRVATLVASKDTTLLGQQLENLPALVAVLAEIVKRPTKLGGDGAVEGVRQALSAVNEYAPQLLQTSFNQLDQSRQQALGSMAR